MKHPVLRTIATFLIAAALSLTVWVGAYLHQPGLVELVKALLTFHPFTAGAWLLLSVVGFDYSATRLRDTISYRNVGSKAAAHLSLSGGQK